MADLAVSFALDQLLPLVREEARMLTGIHREFADIKDELESIQAFLKDTDRKAIVEGENTGEAIKTWVKDVREAAFRIEYIIDEYMIYVRRQPHDPGYAASLNKLVHLIKTLIPRHRIASEIQEIKSYVRGINERRKRYSIQQGSSSSSGGSQNVKWHDPRRNSLYVEDSEFVGFEAPRDKLIGWLVKGRKERTVVSVVGMGGQGKTTLANKVFKSQKVIGHFDCHAWITVSQSYNVQGLLRDMLRKFYKEKNEDCPQNISEMDRDSLIEEVRNYLQQKRYVIVFDDVWDVHFWHEIESAVVDNKKGSRVFITTRNRDVAMSCKISSFVHVHDLQPLTDETSLELFYKKAFRFDFNGSCPDDLVEISSKIVKKCNGLPLAIVTIGGVLSAKEKIVSEWEMFSNNLSSKLEKDSQLSGITKILSFSYDDLPYYLKSCLLYFGMYPEDYEIKSKRVIQQWIAEGFVRCERGKLLEEIAEQFLSELVGRSLVQVSSFTFEGKVKSCRVHDLTHEMILKKCKDLAFCQSISEDNQLELSGIIRRLLIATSSDNFIQSAEVSHVRSLLFFTNGEITADYLTRLSKKCKLLKVLDFEGAKRLCSFPKKLGKLIHIKYLSFNYTRIGIQDWKLPKIIGKFQNLENLDLRGSEMRILPMVICKLRKLRHLMGTRMSLVEVKDRIGGMTSLQTLREVEIGYDGVVIIRGLAKLWQLRDLGLRDITTEHGSALCSLLNEMQHLEKLHIRSVAFDEIDLNFVSSPPKLVRKLRLEGKLNEFPKWFQELQNLVKLTLEWSRVIEDPLKSLQDLPNLLHLCMHGAYDGEHLHFQAGRFKNLKELILRESHHLKSIVIEKGAMSSLKRLTFANLYQLKTVPPGIHYLEELELFHVRGYMLDEFLNGIAPDGQDRWIIRHVPLVRIEPLTRQSLKAYKRD